MADRVIPLAFIWTPCCMTSVPGYRPVWCCYWTSNPSLSVLDKVKVFLAPQSYLKLGCPYAAFYGVFLHCVTGCLWYLAWSPVFGTTYIMHPSDLYSLCIAIPLWNMKYFQTIKVDLVFVTNAYFFDTNVYLTKTDEASPLLGLCNIRGRLWNFELWPFWAAIDEIWQVCENTSCMISQHN